MTSASTLLDKLKKNSERKFTLNLYSNLETSNGLQISVSDAELTSLVSSYTESDDKYGNTLFSSTTFSAPNRELSNAITADCLILDLDGKQYSYAPEDLESMFGDYRFLAYETYSSDSFFDKFRWRVIIPLSRSVTPNEYDQLINHFTKTLRLDNDTSTSRCNAIFYLPTTQEGDGSSKITIDHKGDYLNPNSIPTTKKQDLDSKPETIRTPLNTDIRLSNNNNKLCGFPAVAIVQKPFSLEELKLLTSQTYVGLRLAELIGIDVVNSGLDKDKGRLKSKAVRSVLPWHAKDRKPSTGLLVKSRGEHKGRVIYKSFKSEDQDSPFFDLHYVYACQQVGKRIPLERWTRSTSQVWLIRALAAAKIIKLPELKFVECYANNNPNVTRMYESMKLLVLCRSMLSIYNDEAVIFSFTFAELWTGISRQTASKYFRILVDLGVVEREFVSTPRISANGFLPKFVGAELETIEFNLDDYANAIRENKLLPSNNKVVRFYSDISNQNLIEYDEIEEKKGEVIETIYSASEDWFEDSVGFT